MNLLAFNPFDIFSILIGPLQGTLVALHGFFSGISITRAIGAYGIATIALTVIIRIPLHPLLGWQLRTQRRIQAEQRKIAPQMQEMRKKYKGDPRKQSEEMQRIQKEHGINPLGQMAGCLPLPLQMILTYGLYKANIEATTHLHNDLGFLWISDLGKSVKDVCCMSNGQLHVGGLLSHPLSLIFPLLAGFAVFVQARMLVPPVHPGMTDQERQMTKLSRQMSFLGPVSIFLFSFNLPQSLAMYWAMFYSLTIIQQFHLMGWGGLTVPPWFPGAERTTPLSHPKITAGAGAQIIDQKSAQVNGAGGASQSMSEKKAKRRKKRR